MPPDSGGILRGGPRLGGTICPNVVSRVGGRDLIHHGLDQGHVVEPVFSAAGGFVKDGFVSPRTERGGAEEFCTQSALRRGMGGGETMHFTSSSDPGSAKDGQGAGGGPRWRSQ